MQISRLCSHIVRVEDYAGVLFERCASPECFARVGLQSTSNEIRGRCKMPNPALKALSHRNYRLFFFGQSISLIGTWMTRLATSWLVYRLTGSALLLGLVAFASQMPTFLFAPIGGIWADRLDRRRVLILT